LQLAFQVYDSLRGGCDCGFGPDCVYLSDASAATLEDWAQSISDINVQDSQFRSHSAAIKYAILSSVPVPSPLLFLEQLPPFAFQESCARE
jgi:hypothetical protein